MSSELLRRRLPEGNDRPSISATRAQPNVSSSSNSKMFSALYTRFDLESVLWILVCAVVMYYTDFWSTIVYDIRVKR